VSSAPRPSSDPRTAGIQRELAASDLALVRAVLGASDAATVDAGVASLANRLAFVHGLVRAIDRRRGARLSAEDVEDLAQDVLIVVWRKLDEFHGEVPLEHWTYRVALLEYMNLVRKRMRRPLHGPLTAEAEDVEARPGTSNDLLDTLEQALCRLDPADEEVVRARLTCESSFEELGRSFGMSPNTAKTRYYRGLELVRSFFERGLGAMGVSR
jgi:RNA polymerase sigma-70 factor (ECF subfamily)